MSDPLLHPAAPGDVPALAALHARAFPPAEAWGEVAITTMLRMEGGFGLLARERAGEAPLGFVLARAVAGEAEILTLAVDPDARRRGLGHRLLAETLAEAARRGAGSLFLEVSAENEPARALYHRAGAAVVGRRRRYYADGTDALVLRFSPDA